MNGKTVLITGSSRGIGAHTARLFAQHGYAICLNYKSNQRAAESLQTEIRQMGVACIAVAADVSDEAQVIQLFQTIDEKLGRLSVLVNNAAILKPQSRLTELTAERVNDVLRTNVTSAFLCSREAVKRMSSRFGGQGGAIINVSSVASRTGSPNEYIDYAASKGALDSLTKGLAMEVAAEGIRVNGVRPGLIYTDMHADGGEPNRVDRLASKLPMQRGGQPSEVAEAIYWLASDKSSFATGNFIDLAGGL